MFVNQKGMCHQCAESKPLVIKITPLDSDSRVPFDPQTRMLYCTRCQNEIDAWKNAY